MGRQRVLISAEADQVLSPCHVERSRDISNFIGYEFAAICALRSSKTANSWPDPGVVPNCYTAYNDVGQGGHDDVLRR